MTPSSTKNTVLLDFETASEADIKAVGSYNYAQHDSTIVLCLAYYIFGEIHTWEIGDPPPTVLFDAVDNGFTMCAHNATFERLIWENICVKRMGWPPVEFENWSCTAARAASVSLPRKLSNCGAALGCEHQKDSVGHRLMLKLCRPKRTR